VLRFTPTIHPDESQQAAAEKEHRGRFGDGSGWSINFYIAPHRIDKVVIIERCQVLSKYRRF